MSPHVSEAFRMSLPRFMAYKVQLGFYRSFGRPIAKVFLGAVFTYQVIYFAWVKLDVEDVKDKKSSSLNSIKQKTPKIRIYLTGVLGTLRSLEAELQKLRE